MSFKGKDLLMQEAHKKIFFSYSNFSYSNSNSGCEHAEQRSANNTLTTAQIKPSLHLSPVAFISFICSAAPGQVLPFSPNPSICCYLSVNFTSIKTCVFWSEWTRPSVSVFQHSRYTLKISVFHDWTHLRFTTSPQTLLTDANYSLSLFFTPTHTRHMHKLRCVGCIG